MTLAGARTFPVELAAVLPGDEDILMRWAVVHLADCERWLSRRGFGGFADSALAAARLDFGARELYTVRLPDELDAFAARRRAAHASGAPSDDDRLASLADRLAADLYLYRGSLAKGGVDKLRLVPISRGVTPLFLVQTHELFFPQWMIDAVPGQLFADSELFPSQRAVSTSWVFFQTPVLDIRARLCTVAQALRILEYDYP